THMDAARASVASVCRARWAAEVVRFIITYSICRLCAHTLLAMLGASLHALVSHKKGARVRLYSALTLACALGSGCLLLTILITASGVRQFTTAAGLAIAVGVLPYRCVQPTHSASLD